ncbi:2Fe-2S iron-sulfur cluster binding domain-containing protein [Paraburkholderia dipogonis]|uniref:2Fe-2S iron-sulfur cluster binding domain-containing protein n=1 Tax=Paraburkholderia dipogonis TaxID=1211383 RepID=A0A4Y8MK81_9BURK|nr:2Fe-2S iron-sulfur cluster binding domain-containing protein [Paraburkholderia dipogonis]TFE37793.1 2Fe-2S iron-sulfur cluster binding domain-containing protein [Paraburkholderia dipogonis]
MSKIPVTLLFSDGVTHKIEVEPGGKLLDAAAEAGWRLLTDCSNGQCGTCSGQCVSGQLDLDDYDPSVLPDDEREDGAVLCCVARVNEPAIVELPYESSEIGSDEPPTQQGKVVSVARIAEETVRLDIEVSEPVCFLPGQYVRMRPAGQAEWRSYSMANENGQTRLVFFVRMVEGGVFSTWLSKAEVGNEIEVSAPRGSFFLRADACPRLFVAGGTGLAPFLAMLRAIRSGGYQSAPTRLLVGVRSGAHLFAQQEIDAIKAGFPELEVQYAAEKDAPPGCHEGYGTDLIAGLDVDPKTQVYLCGPPPMVEAGREAMAKAGLRKGDALCERFA